jgi:uncharacterized membrane protein
VRQPRPIELFEPGRLLAFSDGVFAVAITLLVIDLRLPIIQTERSDSALLDALWSMRPRMLVFAFTFVVVGMSWLAHHRKFSYLSTVDGRLLWLNLFYLMVLCLVPFASSVLGEHGGNRFAFVLYAAVLTATELLSASLSVVGLREPFLKASAELGSALWHDMVLSPLLAGAIFAGSAILAWMGLLALAHWSLVAIIPGMSFFGSRSRNAGALGR